MLRDGVPFTARLASPTSTRTSVLRCSPHRDQCVGPAVQGLHRADDHAALGMMDTGTTSRRRPPRVALSGTAGRPTRSFASRTWCTAHSARWAACRRARPTTPNGSPSCSPHGRRATTRSAAGKASHGARAVGGTELPAAGDAAGVEYTSVHAGLCLRHGMRVMQDCDAGFALAHGGGYPGYGSYVLLFPTMMSPCSRSRIARTRVRPARCGTSRWSCARPAG